MKDLRHNILMNFLLMLDGPNVAIMISITDIQNIILKKIL